MAVRVKKLRVVTKHVVCLLALWFVSGCSGIPIEGGAGLAGTACNADDDCPSGFCDLGTCREINGPYGAFCSPAFLFTGSPNH
ncbi:MAG: hypothetical protein P8Y42_22860 [Exilibacterium sp.]